MANYVDVPFIIQQGEGRSISQGQQKLINVYPHFVRQEREGGKRKYILYSTPGLSPFADDAAKTEGRGIFKLNGALFTVLGDTFYTVATDGTLTSKGTLNTSTGFVRIVGGSGYIVMTDGTNGYVYTIDSGVFQQITDSDFPNGCATIIYIDGYFLAPVPNTNTFQISNLLDPTQWEALDVASAEGSPDNIITLYSLNRQLWILGDATTEVWFDSGNVTFPFERIEGAYAEYGIAAANSVARAGNSFMWLCKTNNGKLEVVKADELIPTPVDTQDISYELSLLTTVSDAEAFSYSAEGHEFYVLTFPTENKTFVYDVTESLWHTRSSMISDVASRWIPRDYAFFNNKHYVIPFNNGSIYEIDYTTGYDIDEPIVRTFRSFPLYQQYFGVTVNQLVLDVERNLGSVGNEEISLRVSRDGGYNFDSALDVPASLSGDFSNPVVWTCLGMSKYWVLEFSTSNPICWVFLGITVDASIAKN